MKPVIVGIGGQLGHDANAAVLVDGQVFSAQEERYSRVKHDGEFPRQSLLAGLAHFGLGPADVTDVVFAEKSLQSLLFDRSGRPGNALTRTLGRLLPERWRGHYVAPARTLLPQARFHFAWHHLSHVAGAFHTSPYDRAAFLCVDGKGEDYSASAGVIDRHTLRFGWEQAYEDGLGLFYQITTHYLGFHSFGSEYKVMGLAPYGEPRFVDRLASLFTTDERGGFRLRFPVRATGASMMAARAFVAEATGVPVRQPKDPLTDEHVDIAASLQRIFETELLKMARFVRERTGERNLVLCGGCAQNCVAAGLLRRARVFDSVFNSPVGGDMGSGLGAALLLAREQTPGGLGAIPSSGFYLGPPPGEAPAEAAPWRLEPPRDLFAEIAAQLAAGKTVAWVRDRMELGARALGARSILADPRQPGMQSRLNQAVKFRESFRPFAPLILAEECGQWFDSDEPSDYMQFTAALVPARRLPQPPGLSGFRARLDFARCTIPSVVHVDYSARLQTVRADTHPDMHRLLRAFRDLTGVPILINTSFNVSGQPIVRTAAEAWECFVNTDIDLLVINDQVYRNPGGKTREEKLSWLRQFAASA